MVHLWDEKRFPRPERWEHEKMWSLYSGWRKVEEEGEREAEEESTGQ